MININDFEVEKEKIKKAGTILSNNINKLNHSTPITDIEQCKGPFADEMKCSNLSIRDDIIRIYNAIEQDVTSMMRISNKIEEYEREQEVIKRKAEEQKLAQ